MYNVQKAGNIIDNNSGRAFEVFKFNTIEDKIRHVRIEREHSRNVQHIYRALLKANADLPLEEPIAYEIIWAAIAGEGGRSFSYAGEFGWQRRQAGFMLGPRYFAAKRAEARLLQPIWAEEEVEAPLHAEGSLAKWQKLVAHRISGSARLDVLLITAFAAPLVRFTGEANPGLNFVGLKLQEFDIAAALVGSVLGQHAQAAVSGWWVKPQMLLKQAQQFNDMLFLAGDLLNCPERMSTRQQHERLLSLRRGRTEGSTARSANTTRPPARWRGIFVTLLRHAVRHPNSAGAASDVPLCLDIPPR